MHNVTNPLQACNDIFYRPNGVFKAIGERNNWSWLPFFLVVIVAVLPNYFYASFVDIDWYQDLIIQLQYADQSPAEQDMFRQNMTRDAITMFSTVGTVIGLIFINTIIATYLNLVTKSDEENMHGFTDWYGFTWWVTLPILINSLFAMFLLFMADDHQVLPTIAAPLSLAYLFSIDMASPWFNLAQSIRLDSFFCHLPYGRRCQSVDSLFKQEIGADCSGPFSGYLGYLDRLCPVFIRAIAVWVVTPPGLV